MLNVQSNQKMHDLHATKHILKWLCQMLFGQYGVKFFLNIIGKLRFLRC